MSRLLPLPPSRSDSPELPAASDPLWLRLVGLAVASVGGLVVAYAQALAEVPTSGR